MFDWVENMQLSSKVDFLRNLERFQEKVIDEILTLLKIQSQQPEALLIKFPCESSQISSIVIFQNAREGRSRLS